MPKIKAAINHLCLPTKRINNFFYSINTKIPIPGFSKINWKKYIYRLSDYEYQGHENNLYN